LRRPLAAAAVLAVSLVIVPTAAASPPTITYTIDGIAGTNGWYRGSSHGYNVVVNWHVTNYTVLGADCLDTLIPGPTTGVIRHCTASNQDGTLTRNTNPPIKIDGNPPTGVEPHLARVADHNGWFNHAVAVGWTGSDATSGIATCSSVNYAGPDGTGIVVGGGCTDKAGNSTSASVSINYDATPPVFSRASVSSQSTQNIVGWESSDPAAKVVVRRAPRGDTRDVVVFRGTAPRFVDKRIRAGVEYVYSLRAVDQASNESTETKLAGLPKVLTLRRTSYVPRAAPNPILRWGRVGGARYYNVQLFRGKKRVLAAWPGKHQLGVPAAWKWDGRRFRLRPGHYRWYVWAGFGPRSFAQYRTVGSAEFIVAPRAKR
jgi:hypothetical protein